MSAPRFVVYGALGRRVLELSARSHVGLLLPCRGGPLDGQDASTAAAELARFDLHFPPGEPFYGLDTRAVPWVWVWTVPR